MTVKSQTQIRRRSTCHRHPATPVTGFCASCLRERLAGIEAAAAAGVSAGNKSPSRELRRSKSCSEDFPANPCGGGDESHRRKSCDVVPRGGGSSLWNLFNRDDESIGPPRKFEAEIGNLGFDLKEEEEEEEARVRVEEAETKTMKELIDLEWTRKKSGGGTGRDLREIAGTFWGKASGLSKKLVKWRRKPKSKKKEENNEEEENYDGVSRRETQSEVGEYGFGGGRRSCDADPRRMSVDDCRRFSFDEPRASWDGCWIGRTAARVPPMVAVVEDSGGGNSSSSPGGSEQTRDYYCRGRRSFECGGNNSDAKVSPATTDLFYGAKLLLADARVSPAKKKTPPPLPIQGWGKMWSIWGGGGTGGGKGKECPVSQKLIRSYSVSCRNEAVPGNGTTAGGLRSREDLVLQRNRSVRYSPAPANADAGLLRFYLTPLRSHGHGRRSGQSRRKNGL